MCVIYAPHHLFYSRFTQIGQYTANDIEKNYYKNNSAGDAREGLIVGDLKTNMPSRIAADGDWRF